MEIDITQLCNYAYGFLPIHKMEEIRTAIQSDTDLRYQYEGILEIMRRFPEKDPEEVAEEMSQQIIAKVEGKLRQENNQASIQKKTKVLSLWPVIAAAASIVLVIGLYLYRSDPSPEQMAMNYIKENPLLELGRDSIYDESSSWRDYWEEKDYTRVVNIIAANDSPGHTESFVLAIAYLHLKPPQYNKASKYFHLTLTNGMVYRSQSNLYLGILEILQHQNDSAIPYLTASTEHQAQLLLKRLKAK